MKLRGALTLAVAAVLALAWGRAGPSTAHAVDAIVVIDVNETLGVQDGAAPLPPADVTVTEAVRITDQQLVLPPVTVDVDESVGVTDSQLAIPPAVIGIEETVGIVDATRALGPVVLDVDETIGVGDSQALVRSPSISVAEGVQITDSVDLQILARDTTPPTILAPPDVTVTTGAAAAACGTFVSDAALGTATATDDRPGVVVSRAAAPAGNIFPVGVTVITWTATDAAGNTATAEQRVAVADDTPPSLLSPPDLTVAASPTSGTVTAVALGTPTVSDNCGVASVTNDAPAAFAVGVTTVTWTARDVHGNTATATQHVTVVDRTPPSVTIDAPADGASFLLNATVAVHYFCDDNVAVATCIGDVPSGGLLDTSAIGAHVFTVRATDSSGNATMKMVTYAVGLRIVTVYPTVPVRSGRPVVPLQIQLQDFSGLNVTARYRISFDRYESANGSGTPSAVGSANPDNLFRLDVDTAIYNWQTRALAAGTYRLTLRIVAIAPASGAYADGTSVSVTFAP